MILFYLKFHNFIYQFIYLKKLFISTFFVIKHIKMLFIYLFAFSLSKYLFYSIFSSMYDNLCGDSTVYIVFFSRIFGGRNFFLLENGMGYTRYSPSLVIKTKPRLEYYLYGCKNLHRFFRLNDFPVCKDCIE